jgi:hypothetical protein
VSYVFDALGYLHILLLLALFVLVFRFFRKYPILLFYCGVQLLTSLAEAVVLRQYGSGSALYAKFFWTDEVVTDLLLFFMIIEATYRAMENNPARRTTARMLATITAIVLLLPFVVFQSHIFRASGAPNSVWFENTSQLFNFGGAILNLGLWTALLSSRRRDPQLLMVSAGLGVAVTGAAISYGLRRLFDPDPVASSIANLLYVLTRAASAFIWCWAFRPAPRAETPRPDAVTTL